MVGGDEPPPHQPSVTNEGSALQSLSGAVVSLWPRLTDCNRLSETAKWESLPTKVNRAGKGLVGVVAVVVHGDFLFLFFLLLLPSSASSSSSPVLALSLALEKDRQGGERIKIP